ncbi:MAG: hypothetical protein ACWA45_08360 [Flavobacteriales bacterium]
MTKIVMVFTFIFSITVFAQKTVSDYSYVIVPDQYEFLNKKDKYQLNSLTVFLFNKYGFHAFLESDRPKNLKICEGIYADLENKNSFLTTKLTVILKDCYGKEIFRSKEGKSKEKIFKNAFHLALRQAFESIEHLQVQQKEILSENTIIEEENTSQIDIKNKSVQAKKEIKNTKNNTIKTVSTDSLITLNTSYQSGKYELVPTPLGYQLYYQKQIIGELLATSTKDIYLVKSDKFIGVGFKQKERFVIERTKKDSNILISLIFNEL